MLIKLLLKKYEKYGIIMFQCLIRGEDMNSMKRVLKKIGFQLGKIIRIFFYKRYFLYEEREKTIKEFTKEAVKIDAEFAKKRRELQK